jgi:DNA-binding beta-propeller fold protein YncE/mono/diheme cytochrome c family protein
MSKPSRTKTRARAIAGVSLASVAILAAATHDSWGRKRVVFDEDFAPRAGAGFDGPAVGGRSAPSPDAPAYLAGGPLAMVGDRSLVIDADSGELVLADAEGAVVARLAIGASSAQLVFDNLASRAFIADRANDRVVIVDIAGDKLSMKTALPTPTEPFGLALSPDRGTLLVTTVADRKLVAFDTASNSEKWRRDLSREPRGVAISPDGKRAAVAYLATGTVEMIDLDARSARHVALDTTPAMVRRFRGRGMQQVGGAQGSPDAGRNFARNAFAVRFIGHGLAVIPHQLSTPIQESSFRENTGSYGGGFSPPIVHRLAFLAGAEAQVGATITVHQPQATAWDPRTDTLFVAGFGSDDVMVIDHASQADARFAGHHPLGLKDACGPQGLAVAEDGNLMVWCSLSRRLAKVTRKNGTATVATRGAALTQTKLSSIEHRGKVLFRTANNGQISARGAMACASCHPEGRADGLSWRIERKELQTPVLTGKIVDTHPYKWDGGDKDLTTSLTMTMRRLGGGGMPANDVKAIAAFLSREAAPRAPRRDAAAVARGEKMFSGELGCASCHSGTLRTDQEKHPLAGTLPEADTPALVGLAASAPYYHDGSAATLEALLVDNGLVHGMTETSTLTDKQIGDLIAYLETL